MKLKISKSNLYLHFIPRHCIYFIFYFHFYDPTAQIRLFFLSSIICPLWINPNHSVKLNELHYNWIAHRRYIASWGHHIYFQFKIWRCFHFALVSAPRKYTDYPGTSVNEIVHAFAKQTKPILENYLEYKLFRKLVKMFINVYWSLWNWFQNHLWL